MMDTGILTDLGYIPRLTCSSMLDVQGKILDGFHGIVMVFYITVNTTVIPIAITIIQLPQGPPSDMRKKISGGVSGIKK